MSWPPEDWCALVSRGIGISPEEVGKLTRKLRDENISLEEIERRFVLAAKANGKKLVFVSKRGSN